MAYSVVQRNREMESGFGLAQSRRRPKTYLGARAALALIGMVGA